MRASKSLRGDSTTCAHPCRITTQGTCSDHTRFGLASISKRADVHEAANVKRAGGFSEGILSPNVCANVLCYAQTDCATQLCTAGRRVTRMAVNTSQGIKCAPRIGTTVVSQTLSFQLISSAQRKVRCVETWSTGPLSGAGAQVEPRQHDSSLVSAADETFATKGMMTIWTIIFHINRPQASTLEGTFATQIEALVARLSELGLWSPGRL